jgi:hypothetical protein
MDDVRVTHLSSYLGSYLVSLEYLSSYLLQGAVHGAVHMRQQGQQAVHSRRGCMAGCMWMATCAVTGRSMQEGALQGFWCCHWKCCNLRLCPRGMKRHDVHDGGVFCVLPGHKWFHCWYCDGG